MPDSGIGRSVSFVGNDEASVHNDMENAIPHNLVFQIHPTLVDDYRMLGVPRNYSHRDKDLLLHLHIAYLHDAPPPKLPHLGKVKVQYKLV